MTSSKQAPAMDPRQQLTHDRATARRRIRATTAYSGPRGLVYVFAALFLLGGLALVVSGFAGLGGSQTDAVSIPLIAFGVASILVGVIQCCLADALFDIADAALQQKV